MSHAFTEKYPHYLKTTGQKFYNKTLWQLQTS